MLEKSNVFGSGEDNGEVINQSFLYENINTGFIRMLGYPSYFKVSVILKKSENYYILIVKDNKMTENILSVKFSLEDNELRLVNYKIHDVLKHSDVITLSLIYLKSILYSKEKYVLNENLQHIVIDELSI